MDIYIVKENETIDDIANRFNLTVNDLLTVNDTNLYEIKPGDILNIPLILSSDFTYYELEAGNTLRKIAEQRNISVETLAYLNGIDIEDYIYPKQILVVPKNNVKVYITKKGDTIRDLENNLGFSITNIMEDNPEIYLAENQLLVEREKR